MKTLFLLLLSLGLSQAHAVEYFNNRKMTASQLQEFLAKQAPVKNSVAPAKFKRAAMSPKKPGGNPVELKPIRNGKFKAEVYKLTATKQTDGSYAVSVSQVCLVNGIAPVFDARGIADFSYPETTPETCQTTVNGQVAEIKVGGLFMLLDNQLFSDEPVTSLKYSENSLSVSQNGHYSSFSWLDSISRDLSVKSMLGYVSDGGMVTVCTPANDGSGDVICEPPVGEFFSAAIENLD